MELEQKGLKSLQKTGANSVLPQLAVKCKIEAEFSNQHLCRLTVKCSEIANCGNTQNVGSHFEKRQNKKTKCLQN
jgi:hypothetical protein